jgi:hypothetical protein
LIFGVAAAAMSHTLPPPALLEKIHGEIQHVGELHANNIRVRGAAANGIRALCNGNNAGELHAPTASGFEAQPPPPRIAPPLEPSPTPPSKQQGNYSALIFPVLFAQFAC